MTAFAFPFRFKSGKIQTIEEDTDEFAAQRILSVIKTEQGELELNPTFGTQSSEFITFDKANFLLSVNSNFSDISIDNIETDTDNAGSVQIKIEFSRNED